MEAPSPHALQAFDTSDLKRYHLDNYPDVAVTRFLDVDFLHIKCLDGGDLYITKHGLPFAEHIMPENWYASPWFQSHREKLIGTSTVYRVLTKKINGRGIELLVKWSRVGQDIPLETKIIQDVLNAQFNSPFEEFSLVEECRTSIMTHDASAMNISLQKPLGIYVPPEKLQLWQTGRSKQKIKSKLAQHPGVEIDILRQYILIYKWVRGLDAVEAFEKARIPDSRLAQFTHKVTDDLRQHGFRVLDHKPAHFIVRLRPDGTIMTNRSNDVPYALVDFELLQRTPEHEEEVKRLRRSRYLVKQRDRFKEDPGKTWPRHLRAVTIMGVDYVWGIAESTNGMLWVVGDDPELFDYFLPERWRKTPRKKLSPINETYYTKTKDDINVVWKISRVGEIPPAASDEQGQRIIRHGYNSPFEEFALAMALHKKGVATVYPRAIYMTGNPNDTLENIQDKTRFTSHSAIRTPSGEPVLRQDHDYIIVWGFWNGPDESLAAHDVAYCTGINALNALRRSLINEPELLQLISQVNRMLGKRGYENLAIKGNHILLSLSPQGELLRDGKGRLEFRLCNFKFIKKV